MGIKERRTKILLALFLLSDVNFTPVTVDDKTQKAFEFSLNQKTRGTISGLLKEELITKTELENNYRLSEKGFYELVLQFPLLRFLKEKWDGKWRIISYEIPEKKREIRDRLRREMQGWGLGPWHRSFWITPHPVIETLRQLVSQKEEEQYIQAFESEHAFGNREILIEKVWQKSILDKKYREMFKSWHDILAEPNSTEASEGRGDKIEKFKKIISLYIDLLRLDPGLPVDLVGEKWIGFEAYNIYKEIRGILLS